MTLRPLYYLAWFQALVATSGSLFFSQGLGLTPCILCWFQRICMYPLVAILTVGILKKDRGLYSYVLPLSITGLTISIYHNLLYYSILPEAAAPCRIGVSCTTHQITILGFLSIPLLSLIAFLVITSCMVVARKYNNQ